MADEVDHQRTIDRIDNVMSLIEANPILRMEPEFQSFVGELQVARRDLIRIQEQQEEIRRLRRDHERLLRMIEVENFRRLLESLEIEPETRPKKFIKKCKRRE